MPDEFIRMSEVNIKRLADMGDGTVAEVMAMRAPPNQPLSVQGIRANDGSALSAGASHQTVGGSDGTNLRPLAIDNTGQLRVLSFAQDNIFFNDTTTALAASATFPGTSRDVGVSAGSVHRYSQYNAIAFADQAGTLRLEMSNDNTNWRRSSPDAALAANTPVILSVPIVTRYYRAVYVNGATAQAIFILNTSFTAS